MRPVIIAGAISLGIQSHNDGCDPVNAQAAVRTFSLTFPKHVACRHRTFEVSLDLRELDASRRLSRALHAPVNQASNRQKSYAS
jgi:hypothetical protein